MNKLKKLFSKKYKIESWLEEELEAITAENISYRTLSDDLINENDSLRNKIIKLEAQLETQRKKIVSLKNIATPVVNDLVKPRRVVSKKK